MPLINNCIENKATLCDQVIITTATYNDYCNKNNCISLIS